MEDELEQLKCRIERLETLIYRSFGFLSGLIILICIIFIGS
jgi:hypothetical protein